MGNSMGCVKPPREVGLTGQPPLPPKRRLRFRRKHKGKKSRKQEAEQEVYERQRSYAQGGREGEEEDEEEEKVAVIETADLDFNKGSNRARITPTTVPDVQLTHSKMQQSSNTLSPSMVLMGSRGLDVSPKPSPSWRGVFCLPGEEETVSAIVDVSSIPSQTTTTTPVILTPALGSSTPGGGRVCRVKERVQGVLEKPWIVRQRKGKKDRGRVVVQKEEVEVAGVKGGDVETMVGTASATEHKGVVHIREVDGKLCVVRTVYPSDYGSPVWRGDATDSEVEVRTEPPVPSPVTGNILKVQLSEDSSGAQMSDVDFLLSSDQTGNRDTAGLRGFSLDTPARAHEGPSLLESGYASDLPLTSPETGGTTPSGTEWGGLTSSSSERLDSMMESPLALQQHAAPCLPQVCFCLITQTSAVQRGRSLEKETLDFLAQKHWDRL
ncbi:uncharacterized protein LOC142989612 [Genypterus blacodes]|uniref:uncharacterized protein LOC142989612 n=1 Tax=Genypterus blacodes TaxID=154954 RepID=UPI003F76A98F